MEPKRVIVLGAGAIGAAIGALLFDRGVPCVLVARGEHGRAISDRAVDLRFPTTSRCIRVPTVAAVSEVAPTGEDLVLLATMGHHTEEAIAALDPKVAIASFQNGLAPLEVIARRGHPTLAAMVYVPAERRAPGVIALAGVPVLGAILVGPWANAAPTFAPWLAQHLAAVGFRAEVEPDMAPWIRAKLLTNLGGIVVALCDEPAEDVTLAAQEEALAVWRAAREPFEEVEALMRRVGPITNALVDGLPRTGGSTRHALGRGDPLETAILHGGIVEAGRARGVATPVNEGLIRLAEQATRERWDAGSLASEELRRRLANR